MGGQSMPLADFFRGRHVRREHRTRVPLVCDQTGIIWVVGHRIADRVKVTKKTSRTLGLRWRDAGADSGPSWRRDIRHFDRRELTGPSELAISVERVRIDIDDRL